MPIHFGTDGWRAVISDTFTFSNLRMVTQAIADAVASDHWDKTAGNGQQAPDPIGDEEILKEISLFIGHLDGIESRIVSDHILNLLEELEGKLPEDREKLLGIIDRYFAMAEEDRLVFRLGRRRGLYRSLDDLSDSNTYLQLKNAVERYQREEPGKLDRDLDRIRQNFI